MPSASPSTLVLVPTQFECDQLGPEFRAAVQSIGGRLELCGFGPIVAAARTAQLIATLHPERVVLLGIAARLRERVEVGSVWRFSGVACDGVGAGVGDSVVSANQMGWSQWPGDETSPTISDSIDFANHLTEQGQLLTVCSASADNNQANGRRRRFPNALAEDMEGFGVAAACSMASTPLEIVRGISNRAGDRDKANWQIKEALQAAAKLAAHILQESQR